MKMKQIRFEEKHPVDVLKKAGFNEYYPTRLKNSDVSAWKKGGVRVYMSQDEGSYWISRPGQKTVEGRWADETFYAFVRGC